MADTPVQRSYEQILSDIVDSFIARTGISSLKTGSPLLSLMEAVAQSQFRNTADGFKLLESGDLAHATGDALTQIAADEGLQRKSAAASFGSVTFTDTSYTKISTVLKNQAPAGQSTVTVNDTTGFVALKYVRFPDGQTIQIASIGTGTITFASILPKTYPSNIEIVQVSGAGNKTIPAGTSVGTGSLNFVTSNTATILDGEVSVDGVTVVCSTTGTGANVPAKSINKINSSLPFTASVTNPLGFVNGQDQETDDELRDRVRASRRDKQRGTARSIENAVLGAFAADESKRVVSANLADTGSGKATLYIDDGTGYEGITTSVGIETLTASAVGGEKYFELQGGRPVAHCFIESELVFPANLEKGGSVTVVVGSGTSTATLPSNLTTVFANPKLATSFELVSFINSQTDLKFVAATRDNHTKIILYPKADTDNVIEVSAQTNFGFPVEYPVQSLYLFKNGVLQVEGGSADYVLNKNKGQIFLNTELSVGDILTVGSVDVRVGILTSQLLPKTYSNQYIWLVADSYDSTQTASLPAGRVVTNTYNSTDKELTLSVYPLADFVSVDAGDWLILWDSNTGVFWTKRVLSNNTYSLTVESNQDLSGTSSTVSDSFGVKVFRSSHVPQKIHVSTYTNVANLVSDIRSQLHEGIFVEQVGSRILFRTSSYNQSGAINFLTGTPSVTSDFGFTTASKKSNPSNYQVSLTSNSELTSFFLPSFLISGASPRSEDVGRISFFFNGEQQGFWTTQENTSTYRSTLNGPVVLYDSKYVSSGFHISDTDKLNLVVDGDVAQKYELTMAIPAKINGTSVTSQDGTALDYLDKGYSLNDWAIWSASNQTAAPTTDTSGNKNITYTSKKYGPSNTIRKIEYAYPLSAGQDKTSYETVDGVLRVVLPSGAAITPTAMDSTQRFWIGNYDNTDKTFDFVGGFSGTVWPSTSTVKIVRVSSVTYEGVNVEPSPLVDTDCYLYVADEAKSFKVVDVKHYEGDDYLSVYVYNDGDSLADGDSIVFSVSKNESAQMVSLLNVEGLFCDLEYKQSYRILPNSSYEFKFRSFDQLSRVLTGTQVSFFGRDTTTVTVTDNPYFSSNNASVVVSRSTDDLLNFNITDVGNDGNVTISEGTYSSDFVNQTSVFSSKKGDTFTNRLVKFVPITARNVADWINYNLSNSGVSASVSSFGKVEVVRSEGGSDSSIEVTDGSSNSLTSTVTSGDLNNTYVLVNSLDCENLVVDRLVSLKGANGHVENTNIQTVRASRNGKSRVNFSPSVTSSSFTYPVTLTAINKLGFPEKTPATNSDGYKYYAGLIGEANRIVYGDPQDPTNYGGYASANANIEVVGPQVKQVSMVIYVKMSGGFNVTDAKAAVRNAAAAVVNSTPVGQSVAYSDVVAAVNAIPGVFSVAIKDHTTETPTIPVLASEKPLIIDLEKDLTVNIQGI